MCSFSQVHTQEYQQTHRHTYRQIQIQPNTLMKTDRDKKHRKPHRYTAVFQKDTHIFRRTKMRQHTKTDTDTHDQAHKRTHTLNSKNGSPSPQSFLTVS